MIQFRKSTIFDARWEGSYGIARMATEIQSRIFNGGNFLVPSWPSSPLSPVDAVARGVQLLASPGSIFYSPGFNPPLFQRQRAVFTLCDLIHLKVDGETGILQRLYYEHLVKPAVRDCFRVLTISEYSRQAILEWSGVGSEQIVNIGCGVGEEFFQPVSPWQPGYPYLLYIGARKPHKNLDRLLSAYAASTAARDIRLVLSGVPDAELLGMARQLGIADRLVFAGRIPDAELPAYYRGAVALLFPSTYEGFGLPPVEAMASGTVVLTSNTTSMPETVGDAALLVNPYSIEALQSGIDRVAFDVELRQRLSIAGPQQARRHNWDAVAGRVSAVLDDLKRSVQRGRSDS
jgi:glycosyltransferase involved in cell wall biosynthesis